MKAIYVRNNWIKLGEQKAMILGEIEDNPNISDELLAYNNGCNIKEIKKIIQELIDDKYIMIINKNYRVVIK